MPEYLVQCLVVLRGLRVINANHHGRAHRERSETYSMLQHMSLSIQSM